MISLAVRQEQSDRDTFAFVGTWDLLVGCPLLAPRGLLDGDDAHEAGADRGSCLRPGRASALGSKHSAIRGTPDELPVVDHQSPCDRTQSSSQ
jgi:hypothetical protein